jgi:hypothetical protein
VPRSGGCVGKQVAELKGLRRTSIGGLRRQTGKGWKGFYFFLKKEIKPKFKHKFEFNQPKLMLQHVCNSKLLYFIILINKMIKCLEKHKHLIFLKQERLLLSKFLIKHKGEI